MGRLVPLAMLMSALDNRPTRMRFTVLPSLLMVLSIGTSAWAEDYLAAPIGSRGQLISARRANPDDN